MSGDPPRRPRRVSLDVILIVAAMLAITAYLAWKRLWLMDVRWAVNLGESMTFDAFGLATWSSQGGALLLIAAALVVRLRSR